MAEGLHVVGLVVATVKEMGKTCKRLLESHLEEKESMMADIKL
jgi:hypothetical protein